MTKVVRSTPMYFLPYLLFSFQTPKASQTFFSVSASSVNGNPCFLMNLPWDATSSGLTLG